MIKTIEFIFPTCKTCKYFNPNKYAGCAPYCDMMDMKKESALFCSDQAISIRNPEKFFCSEHETKEGQRFVNWGTT